MISEANKKDIIAALEQYMQEHELSQNDVIKKSGVNSAYITAMRKGEDFVMIGNKKTDISERYYKRLAEFVGFNIDKNYWKSKNTPQFLRVTSEITEAKRLGETTVIIGETGCGKTFACERIKKKYPNDFFHVIVSNSDTLKTLIVKIFETVGIQVKHLGQTYQLRELIRHLRMLDFDGYEPVIAFDESEYMKAGTLCAMKELHDALDGHCSIVILGTEQLLQNIDKMVKSNRQGMPQFFRRIKYRIRRLPAIDRNFNEFLNGRFDKELEQWLKRNCNNYGELHDVLLPALREADRLGEPVTLDFVKKVLGIIE